MKHLTGVLTTALLLAAMTLTTGCSKDESNMEEVKGQTEEDKTQQIVNRMKEHIVGTWEHDGDFVCADLSELTGTINDGIISGCTSEFDNSNPATLTFGTDGDFKLQRKGVESDWAYTGTYTISRHDITGEPYVWLKYDEKQRYHAELMDFDYHEVFFEADYNTVYFVANSWAVLVSRYRKNSTPIPALNSQSLA